MAITLRTVKGTALTHSELDNNFTDITASMVYSGSLSGTTLTLHSSGSNNTIDLSGLSGGSGFDVSAAATGELLFKTSATTADGKHVKQYYANGGYGKGITIGYTHSSNSGLNLYETSTNGLGLSEDHVILSDSSGSNLVIRNGGHNTGNGYIFLKVDEAGLTGSVIDVARLGGPDKSVYLYHSGSNVFYTDYIGADESVIIPAPLSASSDVYLSGLSNTAKPHIVGYDAATGQLTYYSTGSFGSGGGSTDYVSGVELASLSGSAVDISALNTFTGSIKTEVDTLTAATSSYLTGADTGSFVYSGSFNSAASVVTLYSKDLDYDLDLSGLAGGGGGFAITASNEGTDLTNSMSKINFVGNAVEATNVGSIVTVTVNTGSAASPATVDTGSMYISSSVLNNTITFTQGDGTTESVTVNTGSAASPATVDTGSMYISSSVNLNTITFTQGDGTTESVTVNTGSADNYVSWFIGNGADTKEIASQEWINFNGGNNITGAGTEANPYFVDISTPTGSLMVTGSVTNNTLTFTKGDGSTFDLTVATGSAASPSIDTGSFYVSSSAVSNVITFTQGDGTTESVTVATGSAVDYTIQRANNTLSQATDLTYLVGSIALANGVTTATTTDISQLSGKTLGADAFLTATVFTDSSTTISVHAYDLSSSGGISFRISSNSSEATQIMYSVYIV